ncbi:Cof-type HAD-IIB family hydrolase [Amnibacterium sp. CER49]|uniref:Cof-type HAD-IIB family hydrolase n=1 Tax=Amnibacterium sp. CER49 TaxID=3039161 RepID=UPI0024479994|nr:Cof-type HAD-IIB family hydrolase [Amnibacterium sp. CER49]MDH2443519.1 Cof-type HAD-IIB family hydrolase [Amnibacterium sp. CER49]
MPIADLPTAPDLRLVVADMDGTLLDGEGRIPDDFWSLIHAMRSVGVVFSPASGRQYATLHRLFAPVAEGMPFIAENGTFVVQDGRELSSSPLDSTTVAVVVNRMRAYAHAGRDMGTVVCGKRAAYTERSDARFLAEAKRYYANLQIVEDVLATGDDVIKLAMLDFEGSEHGAAVQLADLRTTHQVVVSNALWVDVMARDVDKGAAVRALQATLRIGSAQTAAFGDYLNDLEMLDAADYSFAMANAHPDVLRRARYVAPANTEHGVVTTLRRLLGV